MRMRILLAAAVTTIAVAACSNPPQAVVSAGDADFVTEVELAISAAEVPEARAVVSRVEVKQPISALPDERVEEMPADGVGEDPILALSFPQPSVLTHTPPDPLIQEVVSPRSDASQGRDLDADDRLPSVGRGTGVIIRGSVGERDPCVIHLPGGSRGGADGIGILINNPRPRVGGGRYPTGERGASPGRGVVFYGGVR